MHCYYAGSCRLQVMKGSYVTFRVHNYVNIPNSLEIVATSYYDAGYKVYLATGFDGIAGKIDHGSNSVPS